MATAIARVADPHLTIDVLQSLVTDFRAVVDAAAYLDGEELPPERRRCAVGALIDVARRLAGEAQDELNRFPLPVTTGVRT